MVSLQERGGSVHKEVRVVADRFFNHYDAYIKALKRVLGGDRWNTNQTIFKDGSPWLQILPKDGTEEDLKEGPADFAFVPFWISPQFGSVADIILDVQMIGNALTHQERGRPPLAKEIIGIAPYIELRFDGDSLISSSNHREGEANHKVGEAIVAEIIANDLKAAKIKKVVLLDGHGSKGIGYLDAAGIEHIDVTMIPFYARHLIKNKLVDSDTIVVSLDLGSFERCFNLCIRLNLNPATNMAVFNKLRDVPNAVKDFNLLYGNPEGKNLIILDDGLDTAGSMKDNSRILKEKYHSKRVIFIATHGVLSYPARDNIIQAIGNGYVDQLIISDSLPKVIYDLENIPQLTIIKTASIMAGAAKLFTFPKEKKEQILRTRSSMILNPEDKNEFWQKFKAKYG